MANQRIIDLLSATGMKRNDIAAVLGVDPSTLRRWSYGETHPPADKLAALEQLAGGSRPESPTKPVPQAHELAKFSSLALLEELTRRARGGSLQDVQPGGQRKALRAVAFRETDEDE